MTSEAGREDMIRERAYAIWIEEGRPDGMAENHWRQAADAIEAEDATVTPLTDPGEEGLSHEPVPPLVTPNR